jgi:hypothetical protein
MCLPTIIYYIPTENIEEESDDNATKNGEEESDVKEDAEEDVLDIYRIINHLAASKKLNKWTEGHATICRTNHCEGIFAMNIQVPPTDRGLLCSQIGTSCDT